MSMKKESQCEYSDAAKKARAEYYRLWRKNHPERTAEINKKWRESHPEKVRENTRKYWEKRVIKELEANNNSKCQRLDEMRTQGVKGLALPRINLAFTPKNYEFLRVLYPFSNGKTRTMTGFVNFIIEQYRMKPENIAAYNEAKRTREEIE